MCLLDRDPETKFGRLSEHFGACADGHGDSRHLPLVLEIHLRAENEETLYPKVHTAPLTLYVEPAPW